MATCSVCSTELEGSWKFCLNCGAPLPTSTMDAVAEELEVERELDVEPEPTPEPEPAVLEAGEILKADIPPAIPAAIRPEPAARPRTINLLSMVAIALGVIGGPVAIIFGFFAVRQIRQSGERGMLLAQVAIVLGFIWLAVWIVVIAFAVVNGTSLLTPTG